MKPSRYLAITLALFSVALGQCGYHAAAQEATKTKLTERKSPDGTLVAHVRSVVRRNGGTESTVELRTAKGALLSGHDYTSEDGEHGYEVVKASWTPDSQFFVFSMESSGGHSPWHTPVQYFSRGSNELLSLDKALDDAVRNPHFQIAAPDKITVALWFSRRKLTVSLASLPRGKAE